MQMKSKEKGKQEPRSVGKLPIFPLTDGNPLARYAAQTRNCRASATARRAPD